MFVLIVPEEEVRYLRFVPKSIPMLRILLAHYSIDEYLIFKKALHTISSELTVSHIESGDKLFNLFQYFLPDILFINVSVDDATSMRCLQKLRSEPRFNSLPLVIYSNDTDWKYIKEYYFSESNHHMPKPYSFESLCTTLEEAVTDEFNTEQFPFKKALINS